MSASERLPKSWALTSISNLTTIEMGQSPESAYYNDEGMGLPFFQGKAEFGAIHPVVKKWCSRPKKVAEAGDILLSIRAPVGPTNIVTSRSAIGRGLAAIGALEPINQKYIFYFLRSIEPWLSAQGTGSTFAAISGDFLRAVQVPVAPAAEQTRIVEKLEELLSDLDAGVAELKAAQKKLAQYRQSLLKAAVEGALTAEWRQSPAAQNVESGTDLLQRILHERRARWEARQLAKFKEQGKAPPKDWQAKYPEPVAPDTTDLPELPRGWVWATMSQVGWLDRGRSKHRPRNAPHLYDGPYPFVQTGDIRHADTFISSAETTYSDEGLAQSRLWPIGTMCITIAANIGKTAILSMEACFPDSVVGFLSTADDVSVRYIEYFMRCIQQKLEDQAPATAQKNINLEILEKVRVPVPPLQEQNRIVEILDEALHTVADNNRAIELTLRQSEVQRKNILQSAFSGRLVPQDPADESASALLERIHAERAARQTKATSRRRAAQVI